MPIVLVVIAAASLFATWIGFAGLTGQLAPNYWAGVRTVYTRASKENWVAVHRAIGPVLMFGGVLAMAISMAFAPFAFAGKFSTLAQVIVAGGSGGILLGTVGAAWYAATSFAAARDIAGHGK